MAPVQYPRNNLTGLIEEVARRNALTGGAGGTRLPNIGEPQPTVRSASVGRVVADEEPLAPLTLEEKEHFDQLARQAGVVDERLGNIDGNPEGEYSSLEEAIAAGAPVNAPVPQATVHVAQTGRTNTRLQNTTTPPGAPIMISRVPNFRNIQGIDLISSVVYIDDMEFAIPSEDLGMLRRYVIETVQAEVSKRMNDALEYFSADQPEGQDGTNGGAQEKDAAV